MRELGGALVSITLIMMAVFIPVSFISGTSGTFYRQFGLTMAISIFFSALNALTLSPALCAIFLKAHDKDGKERKMSFVDKFHTAFNTSYERILGKYKNSVVKICRRPIIAISAVIIGIAGLMFLMKVTPDDMIPSEDTGTIMGSISLPPGTSQDRTDKVLAQVDSIVAACPAVQSHTLISGYGMTGGQGASYGSIIIKLKPWSERSMKENSQILAIQFLLRSRDDYGLWYHKWFYLLSPRPNRW